MDKSCLNAITLYFDFWRENNDRSLAGNHLLNAFKKLRLSNDKYANIPQDVFSQCLEELFHDEGSDYKLSSEQEKNIQNQLAVSTVYGKLVEETFVSLFQYWTRKHVSAVKALLIVDVQNDFISGSLRLDQCPAKQNAEEVIPIVNELIKKAGFNVLAYTYDWHPSNHCSYLSNIEKHSTMVHESVDIKSLKVFDVVSFTKPAELQQVMWPDHCVQNSWGAELHKNLRKPVIDEDIVVYKGQNPYLDGYSAFFDNGKCDQTDLFLQLLKRDVTHVFLVGLAFDICVAYSAIDSANLGFNTMIIEDACKGVDDKSIEKMKTKFADLNIALLQASDII